MYKLDPVSEAHADRRQTVKKNWLALTNMALETALLAAFEPCLALPHMQEFDDVKKNDLAAGLITDEHADILFESSSLQLIVHAFGMVGGKKLAETATNSAMLEKPDVHASLAAYQTKIRPFFDDLRRMNFATVDACLGHLQATSFASPLAQRACRMKCVMSTTKWWIRFARIVSSISQSIPWTRQPSIAMSFSQCSSLKESTPS